MKKLSLLILLLTISISASAQRQKLLAQSQYDYKKFHFGMALDFGYYNLVNDYSENFLSHPDILAIETESDLGMGVSFILPDLRLNNRLNFRHILTVESAFHLKYRADRINNSRVFVFIGPSFGVDMASEKDVIDENIFKLNKTNLAFEIGAGCDFYFEFFKFAPQIKYSYGVTNLIVQDGTIFTSPLEGFYTRGLQFSLTFE